MTEPPADPPEETAEPGMIGSTPSQRQDARDPADVAIEFSWRYFEPMDYHAGHRMTELGIHTDLIGTPEHEVGIEHAAFHPHQRNAGGVSPEGRIVVESGIFNPTLMEPLGPEASQAWGKSRLRHRLDAIIAHEYEEGQRGTHEDAVEHAPNTKLPIYDESRELLRVLRKGEQRQR